MTTGGNDIPHVAPSAERTAAAAVGALERLTLADLFAWLTPGRLRDATESIAGLQLDKTQVRAALKASSGEAAFADAVCACLMHTVEQVWNPWEYDIDAAKNFGDAVAGVVDRARGQGSTRLGRGAVMFLSMAAAAATSDPSARRWLQRLDTRLYEALLSDRRVFLPDESAHVSGTSTRLLADCVWAIVALKAVRPDLAVGHSGALTAATTLVLSVVAQPDCARVARPAAGLRRTAPPIEIAASAEQLVGPAALALIHNSGWRPYLDCLTPSRIADVSSDGLSAVEVGRAFAREGTRGAFDQDRLIEELYTRCEARAADIYAALRELPWDRQYMSLLTGLATGIPNIEPLARLTWLRLPHTPTSDAALLKKRLEWEGLAPAYDDLLPVANVATVFAECGLALLSRFRDEREVAESRLPLAADFILRCLSEPRAAAELRSLLRNSTS